VLLFDQPNDGKIKARTVHVGLAVVSKRDFGALRTVPGFAAPCRTDLCN
jgi:hypothetical protein